jgi:MSHA pilin protein MshA
MSKAQQGGFTLIELVVVIVILGILAAFAVPRFMGLEGEARASTVKSLGGSLRAAASMARGKCQAQGCGAAGTVTIEGQAITMVNGYPNRDSIALLLQNTNGFSSATQAANAMRFSKTGGSATCWVQYTNAGANAPPAITYGSGNPIANPTPAQEQTWNANLANACN